MALNNSQYETIMREYEDRQTKNRHLVEQRTNEVYQNVEGYRALSESIAAISVSQGKKLLDGDEYALEELRESIRNLSSMKEQLLTSAGYPSDYLEPVYNCP
ncbi:MAG: DNA replication protein DnaC, partial [Lachnospiraceae bacterium]|nr:DNA replication protein DnaC [Lachnospiraceae bacterium]